MEKITSHCGFTYAFFLTFLLFLFGYCDEYNSKIEGKVEYISQYDGETYPAAFAVVSKCVLESDTIKLLNAVKADSEGNFVFENNTKFKGFLSAQLVHFDTIRYVGKSEEFEITGKDNTTVNFLLQLASKDSLVVIE